MKHSIQKDVMIVIEETSSAYQTFSDHNSMNADFAEFASMALGQFKDALRQPEMTLLELQKLLRSGMKRHRRRAAETDWTTFMASFMVTAANESSFEAKSGF